MELFETAKSIWTYNESDDEFDSCSAVDRSACEKIKKTLVITTFIVGVRL